MGYYKNKEIEALKKQETDVHCDRCSEKLTKDELKMTYIDGLYLCSACRAEWERIQKE